jgi:hypothetical protein
MLIGPSSNLPLFERTGRLEDSYTRERAATVSGGMARMDQRGTLCEWSVATYSSKLVSWYGFDLFWAPALIDRRLPSRVMEA